MTCAELSQLIVRRIITRAQEEKDPVDYFSRAAARVMVLQQYPVEEMEGRLLEFGREFGLLVQGVEAVN
jgi:predicted hydrocarbon binding protein